MKAETKPKPKPNHGLTNQERDLPAGSTVGLATAPAEEGSRKLLGLPPRMAEGWLGPGAGTRAACPGTGPKSLPVPEPLSSVLLAHGTYF